MELNNITNTGTWSEQATRLNDNFNKVALGIDTLQEMYESLSQSAIEVVATLPQTGEANKIYRLVGTTNYSDYMYNADDLNTPILMATYNNSIDNEPTSGSNNLVKSGGVEKVTSGIQQDVDDIFSLTDKGLPPYVREITLDGLTSNENLRVFFLAGSAFTFQVFQNNNLISYCSIPKTQDDNYYILRTVTGTLLEYQSSGVTGSIILTDRFIPKYLGNKYFNITYPHNESLFSNKIHNVLENADIKARKSFWKLPKKNYNYNHAIANLVVREIYFKKQEGSSIDENNIVLGNIRKGYNNKYIVVFYVGDDSPSSQTQAILVFESNAQDAVGTKILKVSNEDLEGYIVIDWDLLENGANLIVSISTRYLIDWSIVSDIANSPSLYNYLYIVTKLNTPDISWVDDDFLGVEKITDICDNVGCKCDFAVIPQVSGGTGEYPTDYVFDFDPSTLQKIASVENAGYHVENHPVHKGWYSSASAGSYQGRAYTEYLLVSGLRLFKKSDVLNSKCVIYPGDSGSRQEVIDMCRSHLEYGIKSDGKYNNGVVDPMKLERLFIRFSSTKTKTYYKNIILEAYNKGAWLIIGTHSWEFTESDVTDETSMTTANLQEIVSYANNLSNIKPVSEIFRKRKQMFDLYKIV